MRLKRKVLRGETAAEAGLERASQNPLRPGQCARHLRKTVAGAYRAIVEGFVEEAKKGGCQHLKMATEVVTMPVARRKRGRSSAETLLEGLSKKFGELPGDEPEL